MQQHELSVMERQVEIERLKHQVIASECMIENSTATGVNKAQTPTLPTFQDGKDDIDAYLERFQRLARSQNWDESDWAITLSVLLTGKALEVYSRLPSDEANEFQSLKEALLKGTS